MGNHYGQSVTGRWQLGGSQRPSSRTSHSWSDHLDCVQCVQVVETGAAVTWSFFAMPAVHLDEDMPALQVRKGH